MRHAPALLALLSACGGELSLRLELPSAPGAQSLLLYLEGDQGPELQAIEATAAPDFWLRFPRQTEAQARATRVVAYARPLAELELPAGRVELVREEAQDTLRLGALGAPLEVFAAELEPPGWTTASELPAHLVRLVARRRPPPCAELTLEEEVLRLPEAVQAAVPLSAGAVYVVTTSLEYAVLDEAGLSARRSPLEPEQVARAVRGPDGQIYLAAYGGSLWRAAIDPALGVRPLSRFGDVGSSALGLAVGMGADGVVEGFVTTSAGELFHFSGDRLARVGELPVNSTGPMAWVGPGEAFVAARDPATVLRISEAGAAREVLPTEAHVFHLIAVPELGLVAGTQAGNFFLRDAEGWRQLGEQETGWWAISSVELERGFLTLYASGALGAYRPLGGYCPLLEVLPVLTTGTLVRSGDVIYALGEPLSGEAIGRRLRLR